MPAHSRGASSPAGLVDTYLLAAGLMIAGVLSTRLWPLHDVSAFDRTQVAPWPEPQLVLQPGRDAGPVLVTITYAVPAEREERFLEAIGDLRSVRLQTGATRWGVFRDGEEPHTFMELFVVPSWDEHLRQHHDRLTGYDLEIQDAVANLADAPPVTSHYIAAEG